MELLNLYRKSFDPNCTKAGPHGAFSSSVTAYHASGTPMMHQDTSANRKELRHSSSNVRRHEVCLFPFSVLLASFLLLIFFPFASCSPSSVNRAGALPQQQFAANSAADLSVPRRRQWCRCSSISERLERRRSVSQLMRNKTSEASGSLISKSINVRGLARPRATLANLRPPPL